MAWTLGLVLPMAAALAYAGRTSGVFRARLLLLVMGAPIFIGAASVPWALLLFAGVRSRSTMAGVDLALWVVVLVVALRARRRPDEPRTGVAALSSIELIVAAVLLLATAAIAIAYFVSASAVAQHGEWDAWAQWNLRARFFYRGMADGTWRQAFEPVLAWSHADYPPLIPSSVARLWMYAGRESVAAPIALAAIVSACTVTGAALSVAKARGTARGCLAAAAMLACPSLVRWAPSQCADMALACFMLAAFVMWQEGRLGLAGLAAGLAAWTKNEGEAFLVVFVLLVSIAQLRTSGWRGWRPALAVAASVLPAAAAVLWFKYALAPPSYFVTGQTIGQTLARMADSGRLHFVASVLGRELWLSHGSWVGVLPIVAVFGAVRGIDRAASPVARWAVVAAVLMTAVYMAAYLATPLDLAWQLETSVERVVLQLVPLFVWAVLSFAA